MTVKISIDGMGDMELEKKGGAIHVRMPEPKPISKGRENVRKKHALQEFSANTKKQRENSQ